MDKRDIGILAVVAIGSGMIILFLLAGITVAVGHSVPTEYWAAAGSLSGALVGILAPQPATKGSMRRQTARLNMLVASGALRVEPPSSASSVPAPTMERMPASVGAAGPSPARAPAGAPPAPPVDLTTEPQPAVAGTVVPPEATRLRAAADAVAAAPGVDLRVIGLILVGLAAFIAGIWLALTVGNHVPATPSDTAVEDAANALIAIGSAAGGALVGLLAPTPGRPSGQPG